MKLKKILQMVLLLSGMGLTGAASAASPLGCYPWETGELSLSLNVPVYLKLKASTQAVFPVDQGGLGMQNSYAVDNSFFMRIVLLDDLGASEPVLLEGNWEQTKGSSYKVNIPVFDSLAQQIAAALGIENADDIKVTKSFTGSVTKDSLKTNGGFSLGVTVVLRGDDPNPDPLVDDGKVLGKASFKIAGHFEGTKTSAEPCELPAADPVGETAPVAATAPSMSPGLAAFGQRFVEAVKQAESQKAQ